MTMKLKVNRFRTRRVEPVAVPTAVAAASKDATAPKVEASTRPTLVDNPMLTEEDDGFGDVTFNTARGLAHAATSAAAACPTSSVIADRLDNSAPQDMDSIRREGLTGRQLRMARRLAQKHGLPATSDFDAVRLLRKSGIDPFLPSSVMDMVSGDTNSPEGENSSPSRALTVSSEGAQLPRIVKPVQVPSTEVRTEEAHIAEVRRIQRDIVRRRRRKLAVLWARLGMFVILPTLLAGWYYFVQATPFYASKTEFVIQQSTATSSISSLFSGTSFATSQDSVVVQGYLQSPEAMERLDKDIGFRAHFSDPRIDPIQRLSPDASNTETYAIYKRNVKISYDPTEGVIKMEVDAADPQKAVEFSRALIGYAEDQVDQLTHRLREDQMKSAKESFTDAEAKVAAAQQHLVALQEKYNVLSSEAEAGLITGQIGGLESQLTQEKLSLAQMESNAQPNAARMEPVKRRIATLEDQIAQLRSKLTVDGASGASVATVQSELLLAQGEVATRQMMLAQAMTAMETARIEANRQTRYLSISVDPVAADDPAYPRAFENTLVVMLIFAGIYLMISMTIAILREQVTG